jgi:hypothetical protein
MCERGYSAEVVMMYLDMSSVGMAVERRVKSESNRETAITHHSVKDKVNSGEM